MTTTTPRRSSMLTVVDVLSMIQRLRDVHHACTAGALARQMRYSKTHVANVCQSLKDAGLVDWTTMPGSLHLTAAGVARLEQGPSHVAVVVPEDADQAPADEGADGEQDTGKGGKGIDELLAEKRAARAATRPSGHV